MICLNQDMQDVGMYRIALVAMRGGPWRTSIFVLVSVMTLAHGCVTTITPNVPDEGAKGIGAQQGYHVSGVPGESQLTRVRIRWRCRCGR